MLSMALWLALDDLMAQLDDLCHSYLYFCVDHPSTNKYQKYKSVELGDQLIRAGPQSQNWLDQQNTLDTTGSIH